MDIFALLTNAKVTDLDGDEFGDIVEVSFANGRLTLVIETPDDDEDEDPEDGDKEPIPVEELGSKIRAIGGGGTKH